MVAGGTLVGGTYVFAKIPAPEALPAGQSTRLYYADGKTEMAKVGRENRTIVSIDKIPKYMQHAVVAAEDNTFYTNDGVDIAGIARAAWNNVTGGERQGASTITQQYARSLAKLTEDSYKRKMQEAAIAMKLDDEYTKDEILGFYLNTVYFGRGAYGVEAAAKAYFKRNSAMELTVAEAIALAGMIKNPDAGGGSSAFDPNVNPEQAQARYEYTRDTLVKIKPNLKPYGSDSYEVPADLVMPTVPKYDPKSQEFQAQFGLDLPTGLVVHNVMDELSKLRETDRNIKTVAPEIGDLKTAGFKIITTLDPTAQALAQSYADVKNKESPLFGIPDSQTAAMVAVEPLTGRVLAYYGGPKGDGVDFAGYWKDPILSKNPDEPTVNAGGFHPPASSFKIYTLAAGLSEGISVKSYWDGKPRDFPGRKLGTSSAIRNANAEGSCANNSCTLADMVAQSLNVPMYQLTLNLKNQAASVLETARAAGIRYMEDVIPGKGDIHDLNAHQVTELANTGKGNTGTFFDTEIGFGQYPITVIDHANGVATLAAGGAAANVHFIAEIYQGDSKIFTENKKLKQMPNFTAGNAADEAWVLQKVAATNKWNPKGRTFAAKTGTWENGNSKYKGDNSHSWTVGYNAPARDKGYNGIAVAVWVGNKGDELPIKTKNGAKMQGSSGAGLIFAKFMDKVTNGKPVGKFPAPKFLGDEDAGDGESPGPSTEGSQSQGPGQGNPGPGGGNNRPGTNTPGVPPNNGGNGGGNGRR